MSTGKLLVALLLMLWKLAVSLLAWLLVASWASLIPRRRDWIVVIGRDGGQFLDNAKYFFLQASEAGSELRIAYVTERAEVKTLLRGTDREALRYPGVRAIWLLCRCGVVIVDEASWYRHGRRFLLAGARVIQLWHGVGGKRIGLDHWRHETGRVRWASGAMLVPLRLLAYRITGRWVRYAAVACTSRFYRDEVFRPAFSAHNFPITGYPRNDFGQSLDDDSRALACANVDAAIAYRIAEWREQARRLVFITPTFRESGSAPMALDADALREVDAFADTHGVEFLFKFHPLERNTDHITGRHFHVLEPNSDVYPLLTCADALVTDYSSIATDFLWVDKPLLFLIPEYDDYVVRDRQLQFDPRALMPGPVVSDWHALLLALQEEWAHDSYRAERSRLRLKAFDNLPQSQAVPKLLEFMEQHGWVHPQPSGTRG